MRAAGVTAIVLGLAISAVQAADLSTREANRVQEAATVNTDTGAMLARVNRGLMEIIPSETGLMFVTASRRA